MNVDRIKSISLDLAVVKELVDNIKNMSNLNRSEYRSHLLFLHKEALDLQESLESLLGDIGFELRR